MTSRTIPPHHALLPPHVTSRAFLENMDSPDKENMNPRSRQRQPKRKGSGLGQSARRSSGLGLSARVALQPTPTLGCSGSVGNCAQSSSRVATKKRGSSALIMALASMSLDGASDAEERRAIHAVASDERRRERRGAARVSSGAPKGERRARGLQSRSSSEKKSTALGGAKRTSMR
jgi:hypothetical protein